MCLRGAFQVLGARCWRVLVLGWMEVRRAERGPSGGFCSGGDLFELLSSQYLGAIRLLAKPYPWRFRSIGAAL